MKKDAQEWKTVTIQKGESLHDALRKRNTAPDLPCGGKGTCGLCRVEVEKFGMVKSCQFRLAGTYRVRVPQNKQFDVVGTAPEAGMPQRSAIAEAGSAQSTAPEMNLVQAQSAPRLAIDIGTTTVAWSLTFWNREITGGFVNPQRQFGADVMSRILSCTEGHLDELRQLIVEALQSSIKPELARVLPFPGTKTGETSNDSEACRHGIRVAIAANTTMLHILNGWDCTTLGKAPFTPQSVAQKCWASSDYSVTELPGISAFVGADIVSGLYALDVQKQEKPVFFLDLGTNGEMAVGKAGRFLVTSAAAGPAFEASELALSIHASGLLRVLHEMLDAHVMDENGTLCDRYFDSGYPVGDMVLSQDLIRELQMAKAAIRAGIEILLRAYNTTAGEIETLYLAGGMGYFIDPEDAVAVGMIPEAFRGKITAAGNTSLQGAVRFLREPETASRELAEITGAAEEIILAQHPDFEELYIQYMSF